MCWQVFDRRLRVFETNYGREAGWFVERDGHCVAILSDRRWADMFWDSYAIEWVTENPQERAEPIAEVPCLWWGRQLKFRNREINEVVETAFASGPPREGRVFMRGLYLRRSGPWPWEWPFVWMRRRKAGKEHR